MKMNLVQVSVRGEYAVIPLTKGKYAKVDIDVVPVLCRHRWHAIPEKHRPDLFYAARNQRVGGRQTIVSMHRVILGCSASPMVDHENGDGLDNRRRNLRPATNSQNQANTPSRGGRSKYKGVQLNKKCGKWFAVVRKDGKCHYGSLVSDEVAAAADADRIGRSLYGDFWRANLPEVA